MRVALLAACSGDDSPRDRVPTTSDVTPSCASESGLCSAAIAAASSTGTVESGSFGYELESGVLGTGLALLAGAPHAEPTYVVALSPIFSPIGTWTDPDPDSSAYASAFGGAIAFHPSGERVAVGASHGGRAFDQSGVVYVFDRLPVGDENIDPLLTLNGDLHPRASYGQDVLYADLTGAGIDLVVGTGSTERNAERWPNGIFRYDTSLTGEHGHDVADASIWGGPFFGQYLAAWDGDRDGLAELVSHTDGGLVHFATPWVGDLAEADADVVITERDPVDQFGTTLESVGDLDGDGGEELAIGANTYGGVVERGGGLWLLPAGPLAWASSEDLPYAFHGTTVGEGVGSAATAGDHDGDGHRDLVVGAMGLLPGEHAGAVLGYLGPLSPGVRTSADADFVVQGERVHDWFGADAETIDADGDGRDDLVVSAQAWDLVGKVYLFLGADLLP